jgi:APA family basic amino acid/polyamine antiporter
MPPSPPDSSTLGRGAARPDRREAEAPAEGGFRRELGLADASVVVAGAIIGVGIFANPSNVARILEVPWLILLAWGAGGLIALLGGFAYAELGSRLPHVGGQYTYLARAYHPVVGFLYGIALLFIINGGALAAVAIIFASYVNGSFVALGYWGIRAVAAIVLIALAAVNSLGIAIAIGGSGAPASTFTIDTATAGPGTVGLLFTALVPIMFAYGGWQNCGAVAAEIRNPARTLAWANVIGVSVVVVLYLGLNVSYLWVLTPEEVGASTALASDAARAVAGEIGARLVASLILVSSLGFLAVITLTGPRLYYAMAKDGCFFARAARLHPRYRTPTFTLWLQTVVALVLLTTNTYDQLLSYVVFADWLFFSAAAAAIFVLRRRGEGEPGQVFKMPGHPVSTLVFVAAGVGIVVNSFFAYPTQSLVGTAILVSAAAFYAVAVAPRLAGTGTEKKW